MSKKTKQTAIMNSTFAHDNTGVYEYDCIDGVVYNKDEEECLPKEDIIDVSIPDYYIGKKYKYEARKICEDFELTYNIGTAVTYLLRAYRKHPNPKECIIKAMAHLKFELEKLK